MKTKFTLIALLMIFLGASSVEARTDHRGKRVYCDYEMSHHHHRKHFHRHKICHYEGHRHHHPKYYKKHYNNHYGYYKPNIYRPHGRPVPRPRPVVHASLYIR